MESYSIHTSVRGYHIYKDVLEAALGQLLPCQREPANIHDPYAVVGVETGVATQIVGHVLRAISSVCYFFLGNVTTAYNFAEKTFTNWLQTAKFAKVFSLESFRYVL